MKLGSLFDGIGGFPLAGSRHGFEPVWASEIEPFPMQITQNHFPGMRHLGDITKINGAEIEPVDVVTGGSPCQDLSVAGKRKGLSNRCKTCGNMWIADAEIEGELVCPSCGSADVEATRSGLYMHQIRVVREMRNATAGGPSGPRPRFMVWENVPGAFSSHGGEDFRAVLEEAARIADPTVTIVKPAKGWSTAGAIVGDGWSIAWRVLDAQYWGVPQRRRRIVVVTDFGGETAPEVLFERDGLQGHPAPGGAPGQGVTVHVEGGAGAAIGIDEEHNVISDGYGTLKHHGGGGFQGCVATALPFDTTQITSPCNRSNPQYGDPCHPLAAQAHAPAIAFTQNQRDELRDLGDRAGALSRESGSHQQTFVVSATNRGLVNDGGVTETLRAGSHGALPLVAGFAAGNSPAAGGIGYAIEQSPTLRSAASGTNQVPAIAIDCRNAVGNVELSGTLQAHSSGGFSYNCINPVAHTLRARHSINGQPGDETFVLEDSQDERGTYQEATGTLSAGSHPGGFNGQDAESDMLIASAYAVRRLTPLECCRLQGYPDGWCDITWEVVKLIKGGKVEQRRKHRAKDSAMYKAYGNSVAIPVMEYVMQGVAIVLRREVAG